MVKSVKLSRRNDYDTVSIDGLQNYALPGQPLLPVMTVKYLIPFGKKVSNISLGYTKKNTIQGSYYVEPAQLPIPLSYKGAIKPTAPDKLIYNSTKVFPAKQYELVSIQSFRGYKIAIINIYPVEYLPATGQLFYYENMSLNLEFNSTDADSPLYRGIPQDRNDVAGKIDNPEAVDSYPVTNIAPLDYEDYLIITSDDFADYSGPNNLTVLKDWKEAQYPLSVKIIKKTGVGGWSTFAGADDAAKIRDCITYHYNNGSGTQYVLLVGDSDGNFTDTAASSERQAFNDPDRIPHRGLYGNVPGSAASNVPDANIPSDLYYACLDGPFDNSGNGIYGETDDGAGGGDVDLTADVYVGRAPVDSTTELANFVKKTIAYENSQGSYLNRALMVGENLDGVTYGADYMNEVENGSSANGYTTKGMAESGYFSFSHLYDKAGSWPTSSLILSLNSGVHVLNHLGHATNTTFGKEFTNVDADTLTNTDYFFGYTQGCYSGAFDNRNSTAAYDTEDCVLEHLVTGSNGAFAFVGNTRYGWYSYASTDGPSQRYHREFWDAVINEGITNLGKAVADSKFDNLGVVVTANAERWCYFENNLLGDPHTPITGEFLAPTDFTGSNVFVGNSSWINLSWKNSSRSSLQEVMIRYRTDGIYPTSSTDGTLLVERSATPGATDMFNHTAVTAGQTYHYVAFGYDGSSYEGENACSNRAIIAVIGGSGATNTDRSDCFIASVCYQDVNSKEVIILKKFRDRILLKSMLGKEMVAVYYSVGPEAAQWVNKNPNIKNFVRHCLDIIVNFVNIFAGGSE